MPKGLQILAAKKGELAHISIIGRINNWWNGAESFRNAVNKIKSEGVKDVEVYINSEGGDVFEANEIVNIIKSFGGSVTGKGGALVASAGTYIAMACDTFTMAANGQFMIHKPIGTFRGNEGAIESQLKLLKNLTTDYIATYSKKTGMSEDDIREMIKADNWMNATEAKEKGFIDAVEGETEINAEMAQRIEACGSTIDVVVTEKKSKPIQANNKTSLDMEINATLIGLPADATKEQIEAKMVEMKLAADNAKRMEQEAKLKAEQERTAKIDALVNGAVEDKKITADQVGTYKALAEANYEAAEKAIQGMSSVEALSGKIYQSAKGGKVDAARKDWDYATWAEKDPKGLMAMREDDDERFEALYMAHYGA